MKLLSQYYFRETFLEFSDKLTTSDAAEIVGATAINAPVLLQLL
jgi:hypothetical protein